MKFSAANLWALVPAAGFSRRMGTHKLLLNWEGESLISHLVGRLQKACLEGILILARDEDGPLREELSRLASRTSAEPKLEIVLTPAPTPDMTASVRLLLEWGESKHVFGPQDGFLLAPADAPFISTDVVTAMRGEWERHPGSIIVPVHRGERGHPTLFPASLLREIQTIPPDQGLNWLGRSGRMNVRELEVSNPGVLVDIDTPEDFSRLRRSGSSPTDWEGEGPPEPHS